MCFCHLHAAPDNLNTVVWIISVQSFSCVCLTLRPHGQQHARPPYPPSTPGALLNLMSIESAMPAIHLILCCPLPLLFKKKIAFKGVKKK